MYSRDWTNYHLYWVFFTSNIIQFQSQKSSDPGDGSMIFIWIWKNHMDPFERPCFTYTDSIYIYSHNSVMKTCTCGVVKTCCFYNLRLDKLINLDSIRIIFYKHLILKEQKNYLGLMSVSKWVSIFKNKFHFLQMSYSTLQLSFPSSQMRFLLYSWVSLLHKCVFYFTQCVSYFTIKFPFFTNAFPSLQVSILSYKCVSF